MTKTDFFNILGGLALFIYGMNTMSDALTSLAGNHLKDILTKLTKNRFFSLLSGVVITSIIQSSNAVCVMVVHFVNANIMSLEQSIGLVMGAKIGTTITGQILAFDIHMVTPLIAFLGVVLMFLCKNKFIGQSIASLAVLFTGLDLLKTSLSPLGNVFWFQQLLRNLSNPLFGLTIGILFTVIVQSASSSIGVLQIMTFDKMIPFHSAFFVMLGMNIGASIAPILASIRSNINAKRVAFLALSIEVYGAILFTIATLFLPIIPFLQTTSNNPSRQIANANTIFNVITIILVFPIANGLISLSRRVLK